MNDGWRKELLTLMTATKGEKELNELLEALLTPVEREELAVRWQIVKQLLEGQTQREVRDKLKVSIATVTRGARELNYGSGIFQKLYKRL